MIFDVNKKSPMLSKQFISGYVRALTRQQAEKNRVVDFVASTGERDRHGTVLNQSNWLLDNFNRNGIVGYMHNVYGNPFGSSDPDQVIGTAKARVFSGNLVCSIRFEPKEINPLAEKIFRKVLAGTLKAVSVGFLPVGSGHWGEGEEAEYGQNPTYYYDGQELLEISVVTIPSNPGAIKQNFNHSKLERLRRYNNHLLKF